MSDLIPATVYGGGQPQSVPVSFTKDSRTRPLRKLEPVQIGDGRLHREAGAGLVWLVSRKGEPAL
jgi:hypothetical protein